MLTTGDRIKCPRKGCDAEATVKPGRKQTGASFGGIGLAHESGWKITCDTGQHSDWKPQGWTPDSK